jgi:peptide-methionine (S)-S-oxide reductase
MSSRLFPYLILVVLTFIGAGVFLQSDSTLPVGEFPNPAVDMDRTLTKGKRTAVLAGGCFWCTEAVFEQLAGVIKVISGYAGGKAEMAHYDLVSSGKTDHAESIEITFDPSKISYGQLLKVFFSVAHDPTQLNRQGPDYGRQYRSVIFYTDGEQKQIAEAYIKQLQQAKVFSKPTLFGEVFIVLMGMHLLVIFKSFQVANDLGFHGKSFFQTLFNLCRLSVSSLEGNSSRKEQMELNPKSVAGIAVSKTMIAYSLL